MEVRFDDSKWFHDKYQRNNKRGGLKNLRCFPMCSPEHRDRGFCGTPLTITLKVPSTLSVMDLTCFAEFVPTTIDVLPSSARREGDVVTMSESLALVRDKDHPTRPWIDGSINRTGTGNQTEIVFNKERRGWHYGWASNKHTCNANHALQVLSTKSDSAIVIKKEDLSDDDATSASSEAQDDDGLLNMDVVENLIETFETPQVAHAVKQPGANKRPSSLGASASATKRPCLVAEPSSAAATPTLARRVSPPPSESCVSPVQASNVDEKELRRLERILRAVTVLIARAEGYPSSEDAQTPWPPAMASTLAGAPSSVSLNVVDDVFRNEADDIGSIGGMTIHPLELGDDDDFSFRVPKALQQNPLVSSLSGRMARELAKFVLEEEEFTQEIAEVLTIQSDERAEPKVRFRKFINALTRFLDDFMARNNLDRDQFMELLNVSGGDGNDGDMDASHSGDTASLASSQWFPSETAVVEPTVRKDTLAKGRRLFETGAHGAFEVVSRDLRAGMTVEKDIQAKLFRQSGHHYHDRALRPGQHRWIHDPVAFTGSWEIVESAPGEGKVDALRAALGHPWLLRRLLDFMESKFEIGVSTKVVNRGQAPVVDRLLLHLRRKLFSSGAMVVELDGQSHPWSLSLPVFQGLALEWSYRAWLDEFGSVHHVHDCGHGVRLKRVLTMNEDQCGLTVTSVLEELCNPSPEEEHMPDPAADLSKGLWIPKLTAVQHAKRVVA